MLIITSLIASQLQSLLGNDLVTKLGFSVYKSRGPKRVRHKKPRKLVRELRRRTRLRLPISMTLTRMLRIRDRYFNRHGYVLDMSGEADCMIHIDKFITD